MLQDVLWRLSSLLVFYRDGLPFDHLKHLVLNQRDVILKLDTGEADSFMSILQDASTLMRESLNKSLINFEERRSNAH